jgi:hypothetical protein
MITQDLIQTYSAVDVPIMLKEFSSAAAHSSFSGCGRSEEVVVYGSCQRRMLGRLEVNVEEVCIGDKQMRVESEGLGKSQ